MNATERLENLKASIAVLEKQIRECEHTYGSVYSNPEKYQTTHDRLATIVADDGSYFEISNNRAQFAKVQIGKPYQADWICVSIEE